MIQPIPSGKYGYAVRRIETGHVLQEFKKARHFWDDILIHMRL
jgi:hypothetical protein